MRLRRAFFRWMFPAIVVLPLWLLLGWGVFRAGGWAFFWVLFIAIPSVGIAQLVLSLLVRARPSVVQSRAVSWVDVAGFGAWHLLIVALGFFSEDWFSLTLVAAIAGGFVVFWLTLWQLREELQRGPGLFVSARTQSHTGGAGFGAPGFGGVGGAGVAGSAGGPGGAGGSGSQPPGAPGYLQAEAPPGWGDASRPPQDPDAR